ncbi:MAG: hypothetical protein Q4A06_08215 [Cardiobacteriaceae bacterium]|nr:hypothetical protein [Cardiobacteriaceae bacterium]
MPIGDITRKAHGAWIDDCAVFVNLLNGDDMRHRVSAKTTGRVARAVVPTVAIPLKRSATILQKTSEITVGCW